MEANNDYTHLGQDAVDDILRNLGIVTAAPVGPQPTPVAPSVDDEIGAVAEDDLPFPGNEPEIPQPRRARPRPVVTQDAPISQEENRNIPRIIEERTIYDNMLMSRFTGVDWAMGVSEKHVLIAGAGGIGSWTALLVARLGVKRLTLVDGDTVERHNLSGQFFGTENIGIPKVSAVAEQIRRYSNNVGIETKYCMIDKNFPLSGIPEVTICGFDNMVARKLMFELWKKKIAGLHANERKNYIFIDGRLSIDTLQIFAFRGSDTYYINWYERQFLFSDDEADATQCSAKQTSFMANMIASFICNIFVGFVYNKLPSGVPFMTEYNSDLFGFKVLR